MNLGILPSNGGKSSTLAPSHNLSQKLGILDFADVRNGNYRRARSRWFEASLDWPRHPEEAAPPTEAGPMGIKISSDTPPPPSYPITWANFWLQDWQLKFFDEAAVSQVQQAVIARLRALKLPDFQPGTSQARQAKSSNPFPKDGTEGVEWDYGFSTFRSEVKSGKIASEVDDDADVELSAGPGSVSYAVRSNFEAVLEEALAVAEDLNESPKRRATANQLAGLIDSLFKLGGYRTKDPRLTVAFMAGVFANRLKIEPDEHWAASGKRSRENNESRARKPRKQGLWERRCREYEEIKVELEQHYDRVSKSDICLKIAEAEIAEEEKGPAKKRTPVELLEAARKRAKTISDDIEAKMASMKQKQRNPEN